MKIQLQFVRKNVSGATGFALSFLRCRIRLVRTTPAVPGMTLLELAEPSEHAQIFVPESIVFSMAALKQPQPQASHPK